MKIVIDFIIQYWREILAILSAVITVVLYIVKRRPSYNALDAIKEDVLEVLPEFILSVEVDGNGQRKKNAVIEMVKLYIQKKYKIDFPIKLLSFVEKSIEAILLAPQKKGIEHEN